MSKRKTQCDRTRIKKKIEGQNLATKSVVALGYKLTQDLFIEGEF